MPDTRDRVFDRITVDHLVRGQTRVSWALFRQFDDPSPLVFQLEAGATGDPDADDWTAVGPPVVDGFVAVDPDPRDYGTVRTVHYRVRLTTSLGAYASRPAAAFGVLGRRDWLLARELVRKEALRHRLASVPGWLLKRRRHGAAPAGAADPRTEVVDPLTGDIVARSGPAAAATYGTEFAGGYYAPVALSLDVADGATLDDVDDQGGGNVNPDAAATTARAVLLPSLEHRDVWAAARSDLRYVVAKVEVVAAWRGVPLVGQVELRLVPFSDIVYTIPVPA